MIEAQTSLADDDRSQLSQAARVEFDDDDRYLMFPRQDSREGYREMQDFVWMLEDDRLRELLEVAIEGKGAFRRFKDALYRYPDTEARWFAFRDEREHRRMLEWLASHDIEPEFE